MLHNKNRQLQLNTNHILTKNHAKVLVKPQTKSFDIRKTNTGMVHDRPLALCQHTFCSMIFRSAVEPAIPLKNQSSWGAATLELKYKTLNSP